MTSAAIRSLIETGTKVYLDSVDPDLVRQTIQWGGVGATSNPVIVADLIRTGRFDDLIARLIDSGKDDEQIAWALTDHLVSQAQEAFHPIWVETKGNAGWVSFELDPIIEDPELNLPHEERVARYVELGQQWSAGHDNRMIKVPATPAGLDSLKELCAAGVTLNVTLIFTMDQYVKAREAIWAGAQQRGGLETFKSVYSIFISRIDQYTKKHCPDLPDEVQGQVGILNAKRIWQANREFWQHHPTPLEQEIIFASTGTKDPSDPPWKYVQALAGSDIQTIPPATLQAVAESDLKFSRTVDQLPPEEVLQALDQLIDYEHMQSTLMEEGIAKFVAPQKELLALVAEKRRAVVGS